jgi:hypothetical protein
MPEDEKVKLVPDLFAGLGVPPHGFNRSGGEWLTEIERRVRAAIVGESGVPWEEARLAIERRLVEK